MTSAMTKLLEMHELRELDKRLREHIRRLDEPVQNAICGAYVESTKTHSRPCGHRFAYWQYIKPDPELRVVHAEWTCLRHEEIHGYACNANGTPFSVSVHDLDRHLI